MKFTCTQSDLNTHLSLAYKAVPSRPSHPVLANVLCEASKDTQRVTLTGFDLSLGIQSSFAAEVKESGTLALPAKLLSDIVSKLPAGNVTIALANENQITLKSSSGKYTVSGMDASEYPELPTIDESDERTSLSVAVLTSGINSTLFAASSDESKQVLCGIHMTINSDSIEFAATTGHVLSVASSKCEDEDLASNFSVTIPAKAMREFNRLSELAGEETVSVAYDRGQIVFQWAHQRMTSRLLEGQYPNYRQLIPKSFASSVVFDRKAMISALDRISVVAEQKNNVVKFEIADGELAISVDAADVGSGRETVECVLKGNAIEIAFNVKYLIEGFKTFDCQNLALNMNAPTYPVTFEDAEEVADRSRVYLVMPIQIRV